MTPAIRVRHSASNARSGVPIDARPSPICASGRRLGVASRCGRRTRARRAPVAGLVRRRRAARPRGAGQRRRRRSRRRRHLPGSRSPTSPAGRACVLGGRAADRPRGRARDADAYNRAWPPRAKDGVYAWLDAVDTSAMSADEKRGLRQLRPAWDNYFTGTTRSSRWLSAGRTRAPTALESINGGEAGEGYGIVLDLADAIRHRPRIAPPQLRIDQDRAQSRATVLLSVVGALAVVSRCDAGPAGRPLGGPAAAPGDGALEAAGQVTSPSTPASRRPTRSGEMAASLAAMQASLREVLSSVVAVRRCRGGVVGGAVGVLRADLGVGAGDLAPSPASCRARRRRSSRNVQTVAAGAEEMGASIREIASNAAEASEVAAACGDRRGDDHGDGRQAGRVVGRDRQRRQGDHEHRRADRTCWR